MLELEGRLRQGTAVQVNVSLCASSEWLSLQARIIAALAPFPEARAAVRAAIDREDAPDPSHALVGRQDISGAAVASSAAAPRE